MINVFYIIFDLALDHHQPYVLKLAISLMFGWGRFGCDGAFMNNAVWHLYFVFKIVYFTLLLNFNAHDVIGNLSRIMTK